MSAPARFAALSNTPVRVRDGLLTKLETVFASNPDATDPAYVKLYALTGDVAPDGSVAPIWSALVVAGSAVVLPLFVEMSHLWLAVAAEAGAGLSAPSTAFEVSVTYG